MARPNHYDNYSNVTEIVPGVFVDTDCFSGVWIVDDEGEVCCWVETEWREEPSSITATVNACILAALKGASAVRLNILCEGKLMDTLVKETFTYRLFLEKIHAKNQNRK